MRVADTFEHTVYINSLNPHTVQCHQYYYYNFTVGEIKALIKFVRSRPHNQKLTGLGFTLGFWFRSLEP